MNEGILEMWTSGVKMEISEWMRNKWIDAESKVHMWFILMECMVKVYWWMMDEEMGWLMDKSKLRVFGAMCRKMMN